MGALEVLLTQFLSEQRKGWESVGTAILFYLASILIQTGKLQVYRNCNSAARAPKVCHPLLPPAWRSHGRAISPAFERDGIKYRLGQ